MRRAPHAPITQIETPDALVVGHLTRDLMAGGGWRVGGAALYAARTAQARGLRVAVVTSASSDVTASACRALPGVAIHAAPSPESTTFENHYITGARRQYLRACATPLRARDIPPAWRAAPVTLVAPVAADFRPSLVRALRGETLGLAPQGWLRAWDTEGRVRPRALTSAAMALFGACAAVIVSYEDLAGPEPNTARVARAGAAFSTWAGYARRLVVTRGRDGADLWENGRVEHFPAFTVTEVDPTGAGDVFAMTFLCALAETGSSRAAMVEASQVAALTVEGDGVKAIPSPRAARARFETS